MIKTKKLKQLIKNSEYKTQKNFSEALGMSYQGFNTILVKGKTSKSTIQKICKALGFKPVDILENSYYELHKNNLTSTAGISNRLKELINYLGIGVNEFSKQIGISPSTTSTILRTGSCNIHYIQALCNKIEWLNIRWLLTGEGEIIQEKNNKNQKQEIEYLQVADNQLEYQTEKSKKLSKNDKKQQKK